MNIIKNKVNIGKIKYNLVLTIIYHDYKQQLMVQYELKLI